MSFDISSRAAADTFDVVIIDPGTGKAMPGEGGKPCSITVYGPGSTANAAANAAQNVRATERLRTTGSATMTADEDLVETAEFLAAITHSFNNFDYKGQTGPEGFKALYLDRQLGFITKQVNVGAGSWGNFTKASPKL